MTCTQSSRNVTQDYLCLSQKSHDIFEGNPGLGRRTTTAVDGSYCVKSYVVSSHGLSRSYVQINSMCMRHHQQHHRQGLQSLLEAVVLSILFSVPALEIPKTTITTTTNITTQEEQQHEIVVSSQGRILGKQKGEIGG